MMVRMKSVLAGVVAALLCASISHAQEGKVSEAARKLLPKSIVEKGVVTAVTDPGSPPYSYLDEKGAYVGLEHELVTALANRLGLKLQVNSAKFASIVPAIQSGRFDIAYIALGDKLSREEVIDLVDIYTEGSSIIVSKANPHKLTSLSQACGLRAAVGAGSFPLELVKKQNEICKDKPIAILEFVTNTDTLNAVRSGRADFGLQTSSVAKYVADRMLDSAEGSLIPVPGKRYMETYHAIGVSKANSGLRDAIVVALQEMVDDGSYGAIFKKWGLDQNMLTKITHNDAARFENQLFKLD